MAHSSLVGTSPPSYGQGIVRSPSNQRSRIAQAAMARKTTRTQKEIDSAVSQYIAKTKSVPQLMKEFHISRAGLYLWIRKAKEAATQAAHETEIGPRGVAQEKSIHRDLRLKALEEENKMLKQKLFELMLECGKI